MSKANGFRGKVDDWLFKWAPPLGILGVFITLLLTLVGTRRGWLNETNAVILQAGILVALAIITAIYAFYTYYLGKQTKKQAEASVQTAKEMHEQSLASFRPVIWFYTQPPQYIGGNWRLSLHNIGSGPAINPHWELVQEDARHNRVVGLETFGSLSPGQKMEDAVNTPNWATSGTRVRLSCIYQDIQQNGFMANVPIEFRTLPGDALTFFGLEHIQWQEVPYDQWQTLHERFHQS
ncbi:MAG: hypothetical protein HYU30_08015 [Chloroflexi bacterium]|nr:hypothetical protein [Chloroflexota bacterium]